MTARVPRRLQVGRVLIILSSLAFMVGGLLVLLNPLPGEEGEYARTTFEELDAANPRLADVVWHLNTGIAVLVLGAQLLVILLALRPLAGRSVLAWSTILALNLIFVVAQLAAHLPIFVRHGMEFSHWFKPFALLMIQAAGLATAAKPVFATQGAPSSDATPPSSSV